MVLRIEIAPGAGGQEAGFDGFVGEIAEAGGRSERLNESAVFAGLLKCMVQAESLLRGIGAVIEEGSFEKGGAPH
jgi:hypothetical protein